MTTRHTLAAFAFCIEIDHIDGIIIKGFPLSR